MKSKAHKYLMKKKYLYIGASLLIAGSIMTQSCIGSFSLTNKVLTWNNQVSNKFVNELVFFAFWILPVYEVTAVADLLVINSIEFWSGNKPLEANNTKISTPEGDYLIAADKDGYQITSPNGDRLDFLYDSQKQMWSFSKNGREAIEFLQFEDDYNVKILDGDGNFVDVELTPQGVNEFVSNIQTPMMALK